MVLGQRPRSSGSQLSSSMKRIDSSPGRGNKRQRVKINWEPNCLLLDYAKNGELDRIKKLFEGSHSIGSGKSATGEVSSGDIYSGGSTESTPRNSPGSRRRLSEKQQSVSSCASGGEQLSVNYHAAYTGLTPLHMACAYGHLDVVKYLIEKQQADCNVRDREGWTILHSLISEIPLIGSSSGSNESNNSSSSTEMRSTTAAMDSTSLQHQRPSFASTGGKTGVINSIALLRRRREQFLELLRYLLGITQSTDLLTAITDEGDTVLDCIKETDDGAVVDQQVFRCIQDAMQRRGVNLDDLMVRAESVKNSAAAMDIDSDDDDIDNGDSGCGDDDEDEEDEEERLKYNIP